MSRIFRIFKLDDWIFFLAGLVAIGLGTLGFFVSFRIETTIQFLLGAIGLLITAVVALKSQRHTDIQELKSTINTSRNFLISRKDFVPHTIKNIGGAKDFILDTTLNTILTPFAGSSSPNKPPTFTINEYHKLISERVFRREITYKRVEVIFTSERLELTIARLLLHAGHGHDYQIRHYDPPPKPIPVLNMMSIDNVKFYVGGYDISIDSKFMLVEEERFCNFLAEYWNTLWSSSKPLNDAGQIHWDALKEVGRRVGLDDHDFDIMVKKWSDWVVQERKRYPK